MVHVGSQVRHPSSHSSSPLQRDLSGGASETVTVATGWSDRKVSSTQGWMDTVAEGILNK